MADVVELAEELLEGFFGVEFPRADLAGCYAAVDHLRQFAEQLDRLRGQVGDSAAGVTRNSVGQSVTAFHQASMPIDRRFGELSKLARDLAGALMDYADEVQTVRREVRQTIVQVLMTVGITSVMGFFTAGLADALAASRVVAALTEIVAQLLRFSQAVAAIGSRLVQLLTFASLDGFAFGIADQIGQHVAGALSGAPSAGPAGTLTGVVQSGAAKAADDTTVAGELGAMRLARSAAALLPGPIGKIAARFPETPETTLATRAAARLGGSSLVYTPVLNAEQGKEGEDVLATEAQEEQKVVAHLGGRVIVDLITPPKARGPITPP